MKVFKDVVLEAYNAKKCPDIDAADSGKEERITAVTTRQCCDKFKEVTGTTDSFKKTYLDEYLTNGPDRRGRIRYKQESSYLLSNS